jgi:membrane fusion protein (multidrug efflux system)
MNAQAAIAPDDGTVEQIDQPSRWRKLSRKPAVVGAIAVLVALAGVAWLLSPRTSESTDNAYLQADSTAVAPRVGGLVAKVLVADNQAVRAGDPLVSIDAQDYAAKELAAEAAVADADANVASARAALASLGSQEALAAAQQRATGTSIAAADAEYSRAAAESARYAALGERGFATRRDIERYSAALVNAASSRDRARAETGVAGQQAAVVRSQAPVLSAELAKAEAAALKARAALTLAKQERGYALIRAPISGVVGNRQVQVGDFVQPGSRLMTLVPLGELYVVANFKETQTERMRVGQKVRIAVDALDGTELTGTVESFAPASGSEFTLLPFEPGSGNFTKIVQRVAVRIRLAPGQRALSSLRPGLSVNAKVLVR